MADYAPPAGPPPPKVPEGWKAVWNAQYSEWFYVNIYTKKSQWEKPTEPVYPPSEEAPHGPPPSYAGNNSNLGTNNPYASRGAGRSSNDVSEDERLARKLQAEEEARARSHSNQNLGAGSANDYYRQGSSTSPQPGYGQYGQQQGPYAQPQQQQAPQSSSKGHGLLGKLLGKASGSSKPQYPQQPGYGNSMYGHNYPPQPLIYGGAPYGRRPGGGGLGVAGGAGLGLGAGLLGGAMLAEAADAGDHGGYVENNYYGDDGGDMGGDMGGGIDGDMGGDMGGGDF